MEKAISEIWAAALPIIQNRVSEVTYETIIKILVPAYISRNTLFIQSPTVFYKDTIESRYIEAITNAVRNVSATELSVKIITFEEGQQNSNEHNTNLLPKYTFSSFVKAKSNELAYATAIAVAESPGTTAYNPLFLYGGVGLGKTHLMHSIGNYIKQQSPSTKVLYCSTETFMNELISSIQQNKNEVFREKYRVCDVLLIDDIQFLSERERTQEEFFHTFNVLRDSNKQIVISSDKPPKEIKTLEDRLISRFGQGIIVDLKVPDFETRIAILEKKAQLDNIQIPKDVITFIADNFYSNIRDLEGALNKVIAFAKLLKEPITLTLTQETLKDLLTENNKQTIDMPHIVHIVGSYYNISLEQMKSKTRQKNIAYSRQIAMYMCRKLLDIPLIEIGKFFGGRDHSTVIHSCDKIDKEMEINMKLKENIIEIEKQLTL